MIVTDRRSLRISDRAESRQTPSIPVELALAKCPPHVPVQAHGKYLAPIRNQLCRTSGSDRPDKIVRRYDFHVQEEFPDPYWQSGKAPATRICRVKSKRYLPQRCT